MNAPRDSLPEIGAETYLFASPNSSHVTWLTDALGRVGAVVTLPPDAKAIDERIAMLSPAAVFLDFSGDHAAAARELHQRLKREWPTLPVLAAGISSEPASMLAALRAGVDDFVDMSAPPTDAIHTLRKLLDRQSSQPNRTRGSTLALLGARAGIGVTTLAASLSLLLNDQLSQAAAAAPGRPARRGVAVLDHRLPARDGRL